MLIHTKENVSNMNLVPATDNESVVSIQNRQQRTHSPSIRRARQSSFQGNNSSNNHAKLIESIQCQSTVTVHSPPSSGDAMTAKASPMRQSESRGRKKSPSRRPARTLNDPCTPGGSRRSVASPSRLKKLDSLTLQDPLEVNNDKSNHGVRRTRTVGRRNSACSTDSNGNLSLDKRSDHRRRSGSKPRRGVSPSKSGGGNNNNNMARSASNPRRVRGSSPTKPHSPRKLPTRTNSTNSNGLDKLSASVHASFDATAMVTPRQERERRLSSRLSDHSPGSGSNGSGGRPSAVLTRRGSTSTHTSTASASGRRGSLCSTASAGGNTISSSAHNPPPTPGGRRSSISSSASHHGSGMGANSATATNVSVPMPIRRGSSGGGTSAHGSSGLLHHHIIQRRASAGSLCGLPTTPSSTHSSVMGVLNRRGSTSGIGSSTSYLPPLPLDMEESDRERRSRHLESHHSNGSNSHPLPVTPTSHSTTGNKISMASPIRGGRKSVSQSTMQDSAMSITTPTTLSCSQSSAMTLTPRGKHGDSWNKVKMNYVLSPATQQSQSNRVLPSPGVASFNRSLASPRMKDFNMSSRSIFEEDPFAVDPSQDDLSAIPPFDDPTFGDDPVPLTPKPPRKDKIVPMDDFCEDIDANICWSRASTESTPKKRRESNPSPKKKRDGDSSPRTKGESSPKKKRDEITSPKKKYDGDSSPIKKRDGDDSPKKKRNGDESPRKKRDGDESPRKKRDGDDSPRKKRDGDDSPRKKRDGDESPRKKRGDADGTSTPKKTRSRSNGAGRRSNGSRLSASTKSSSSRDEPVSGGKSSDLVSPRKRTLDLNKREQRLRRIQQALASDTPEEEDDGFGAVFFHADSLKSHLHQELEARQFQCRMSKQASPLTQRSKALEELVAKRQQKLEDIALRKQQQSALLHDIVGKTSGRRTRADKNNDDERSRHRNPSPARRGTSNNSGAFGGIRQRRSSTSSHEIGGLSTPLQERKPRLLRLDRDPSLLHNMHWPADAPTEDCKEFEGDTHHDNFGDFDSPFDKSNAQIVVWKG